MKRLFAVLTALTLFVASGCSAGGDQNPSVDNQGNGSSNEEKALTGTLDEIKDTMFIVTDDQQESYVFTIGEEKPEGFSDAAVGDVVKVTYTGEVSMVDPFTGTVISVEVVE